MSYMELYREWLSNPYFDQQTKDDLIERFYDCTKNGGYLFIGHAESVSKTSRYKHVKPAIYRKME